MAGHASSFPFSALAADAFGSPPPSPSFGLEDEQWCKARTILKESDTMYRVAWVPDPITGQEFENTWEPKENANRPLRDHLEAKKKMKREEKEAKKKTKQEGKEAERGRQHDSNATMTNQPVDAEAATQQPAAATLVLPLGLPKPMMNLRSTMGEDAAMPSDGAGASAVENNLPVVGNGAEALGE